MPSSHEPHLRPVRPFQPRFAPRAFPWEGVLLFVMAFALRAAYTWLAQGPDAFANSDSASYDEIAWNLAQGLGFKAAGPSSLYATAFRPPALPFVLSLVYRVVGHRFLSALWLQCAIGALIPVVLVEYMRRVVGSSAARVAGWLAVVHPMLVFFSGYLLTEPLFALSLLLGLWASAAWVKTPRAGRALLAGALWGASALVRPNALAMPFVVGAWAWFPLGLSVGGRERAKQLAVLLLGVVLAVGPWTLRNARELHAFVPVTTGGGKALLDSNNPLIWNDPATRGGATSLIGIEPWASKFKGLPEPQADALAGRMARDFLMSHRTEWPQMAAAKLARFWRLRTEGGVLTQQWKRNGTPLDALVAMVDPLTLWSIVILPLAIAGVVIVMRSGKRLFLALPLAAIALFTLAAAVYWGALRMRVPIEPLVVFYAAIALDAAWKRWRVRRSGLTLVRRGA